MTEEDKVKEAHQNLDLPDLAYALSQLALKIVMGKEVETEEFDVKLQVPKEIVKVLKTTSDQKGVDISDLLSHLASRGLDLSLQLDLNAAKQAQQPQPAQQAPGLPPELAAIFSGAANAPKDGTNKLQGLQDVMSQLGQLGDLAKKLEEVQKVVENADNTTNKR